MNPDDVCEHHNTTGPHAVGAFEFVTCLDCGDELLHVRTRVTAPGSPVNCCDSRHGLHFPGCPNEEP